MTGPPSTSCCVTRLTGAGRGAIATISVQGNEATSLVDGYLRLARGGSLADVPLGQFAFAYWSSGSALAEEVVVCRRSEHELELHCHGGEAAPTAIVETLGEAGALVADSASWVAKQVGDPIAQAARTALPHALTAKAAAVLLDQYRGALRDALQRTVELVEKNCVVEAADELGILLRFDTLGQRLTCPWRVVFSGAPNVGKSSLINAMLGYQRAIVTEFPGTTRDVLTASTAFDGWPVELVDTAGLRTGQDAVEQEGVARARQELDSADLVISVLDSTASLDVSRGHFQLLRHLVVHSKCDLLDAEAIQQIDGMATSAVAGTGLAELATRIVQDLVPVPPGPGAAVPFEASQLTAIRAARAALAQNDRSRFHAWITNVLSIG